MTGKLNNIQAINTNPLTNEFCKKMHASSNSNIICTQCYSCSMLKAYRRNCVPAFENNSNILNAEMTPEMIPKFSKKNDIVRIHAHGELLSMKHLLNLVDIIKATPDKTFSLYTKRIDLVDLVFDVLDKPDNLILVYSNPTIDKPLIEIPKHFDKIFNVMKNTNLDKINCGGKNCDNCRNCYDKTKDNIIYEMIK